MSACSHNRNLNRKRARAPSLPLHLQQRRLCRQPSKRFQQILQKLPPRVLATFSDVVKHNKQLKERILLGFDISGRFLVFQAQVSQTRDLVETLRIDGRNMREADGFCLEFWEVNLCAPEAKKTLAGLAIARTANNPNARFSREGHGVSGGTPMRLVSYENVSITTTARLAGSSVLREVVVLPMPWVSKSRSRSSSSSESRSRSVCGFSFRIESDVSSGKSSNPRKPFKLIETQQASEMDGIGMNKSGSFSSSNALSLSSQSSSKYWTRMELPIEQVRLGLHRSGDAMDDDTIYASLRRCRKFDAEEFLSWLFSSNPTFQGKSLKDYELELVGFSSKWKLLLVIVMQCFDRKRRREMIVAAEIEVDILEDKITRLNFLRNQSSTANSTSLSSKCARFAAKLRSQACCGDPAPHILKNADLSAMKSAHVVASPMHPVAITLSAPLASD